MSRQVRAAYKLGRGVRLTSSARAVLGYVAAHLGRSGWAWPSEELMSADLGCSLDTIWRAVRQLEDAGLVEVERRRGRVNRYRIPALDLVELSTTPRVDAGTSAGDPPRGRGATPRVDAGRPPAWTRSRREKEDVREDARALGPHPMHDPRCHCERCLSHRGVA